MGSHLSARQDVSGQFDLGEVALANGLKQPVVPHVWLLRFLRAAGAHAGTARPRADLLAPIAMRRVLRKETQTNGRQGERHLGQVWETPARGPLAAWYTFNTAC